MGLSHEITRSLVKEHLPKFTAKDHKFSRGYLTAIVGSKSYPGSARLACRAALATGVGGVQALLPESLWPLIVSMPPEAIIIPLKEHGGELTHASAFDAYMQAAAKSKAILLGCGVGRSPDAHFFLKQCLTHAPQPLVIDADGLTVLATLPAEEIAKYSNGQWILTPHDGEMLRLLRAFAVAEGGDAIQRLSDKLYCIIVAKGLPAYIYSPQGRSYINTTGNPAATTAGCGDVLAGIIAGFLAQGLPAVAAAGVGMFVAGLAADEIIFNRGGYSLLASEVIEQLPMTIGRLHQNS